MGVCLLLIFCTLCVISSVTNEVSAVEKSESEPSQRRGEVKKTVSLRGAFGCTRMRRGNQPYTLTRTNIHTRLYKFADE